MGSNARHPNRPGGRRRGHLYEHRASLSERALTYYQRAIPEDIAMSRYFGLLLEGLSIAFQRLSPSERARLEAILMQGGTIQQLDAARAKSLICTGLGESTENQD